MNKLLIQKRGFGYRKFYLYDDKLIEETRTVSSIDKKEIPLADIGYRRAYTKDNTIIGKTFFWICVAIPFVFLTKYFLEDEDSLGVFFILAGLFWFLAALNYFKKSGDDLLLYGGCTDLAFYRSIPNDEAVNEFIDELILTSKHYIRNQHLPLQAYLTESEKLEILGYLYQREVISKEEYDFTRNDLNIKALF